MTLPDRRSWPTLVIDVAIVATLSGVLGFTLPGPDGARALGLPAPALCAAFGAVGAAVGWRTSRAAAFSLGLVLGGGLLVLSLPQVLFDAAVGNGEGSLPALASATLALGCFLAGYYLMVLTATAAGTAAADPATSRDLPPLSLRAFATAVWQWMTGGRIALVLCVTLLALYVTGVIVARHNGTTWGRVADVTIRLAVFFGSAVIAGWAGIRNGFALGDQVRRTFGGALDFLAVGRRVLTAFRPVLVAYVLFLAVFAMFYAAIQKADPLAFGDHCVVEHVSAVRRVWTMFYFSMMTATTVGYGDCAPATVLGQALVVVEVAGSVMFTLFAVAIGFELYKPVIAASISHDVTSPPPS